jgi:hypothetical protein
MTRLYLNPIEINTFVTALSFDRCFQVFLILCFIIGIELTVNQVFPCCFIYHFLKTTFLQWNFCVT